MTQIVTPFRVCLRNTKREFICSNCFDVVPVTPDDIIRGLVAFQCENCSSWNALDVKRDRDPLTGYQEVPVYGRKENGWM